MRQHSYAHAPHSAHSTARMVDSYGVYHDSSRYHDPLTDRYREPCAGPEYHDTHITYTDPLRAECVPYNDDDGFVPQQRAQVYRAGVVVNASGNSTVVRNSNATQSNTNYSLQNNTQYTNNSNSSHNNASNNGAQGTTNAQTSTQQAQTRGEESETENSFCCGCKGQRKNSSSGTNPSGNPASLWAIWCRPTILLLMLVLVASVFVLASGIMLYYHYIQQNRPSINPAPDPENYWNLPGHEYGMDYPEPCEKTYCAWGAQCVNAPDGKALCQCPTSCKPKIEPVCGTDNVTYDNQCLLRVASCKARLDTRVKHSGECVDNDLCREKNCGYGARCVMSPDGRNASCVCPEKCHSYGDHVTSHPVCGSDGVDYKNRCELDRAACKSNSNITIKFNGKCDPCAGVECTEPEICQLDSQRNPVCRCGDTCPLEFTPVCGSDGKTYSNECTLRQEACRTRKTLNIIYRGKCSSGINPCTSARCTTGQECSINKFGIAECVCPPECEPVMRPVCSKDGRTFPSECELKRSSCLSRTNIEINYAGVCGEKGPCSEHECQFGATCVEKTGSAHCECPVCSSEFDPVCGSDGISYGNECKLRLEACKHRRDITILYGGPCNGCENKKCDFYSVCESDGATEGRCVCPQKCIETKLNNGSVCGTDGVTYTSECELRKNSCNTKQYVLVAYKGNCDLCENVECKYGARCEAGECVCPTNCDGSGDEPVCASNMMTYPNECEMQKAMCQDSPGYRGPLNVVFYGDCRERFPIGSTTLGSLTNAPPTEVITVPTDNFIPNISSNAKEACRDIHCDFEATCELGPDNYPRCTCRFDCASAVLANPVSNKPVCASDLRIYSSICAMKMEACQRQEELRLRPLELCQGMEVKPCKGEKPVTDPVTGRELDCGNGPFRQDCPSGTYCHQTTRFSRCCFKDKNFIEKKSCEDSWFGCCPDGKTPAEGQNFLGCPLSCGCNRLGSYSEYCDVKTNKCKCKPGVGGDKCDRCEPGFWGLPKISSGFKGCLPCGCSIFGSVRDDCEQMTGRCVCKPGVQGQKCTVCTSHNKVLGPNGCVSADLTTTPPATCKELTCYFGATCVERSGFAMCECHHEQCPQDNEVQIVCGSDGQTYNSPCELNELACRLQKDIVVQAFGTCKEDMFPGTDWPLRRYTPLQFTQPDEVNSPLSKSTRHLLVPDSRFYYGSATRPLSSDVKDTRDGDIALAYRPTPATVRVTALLGDLCSKTSDCMILNSYCVAGACTCLPDYYASNDRQSCIATILMEDTRRHNETTHFPESFQIRPNENFTLTSVYGVDKFAYYNHVPLPIDIGTFPMIAQLEDSRPTKEFRACSSSPCFHLSTCIDLPGATFTCICPENYTGPSCESEVVLKKYETPSFSGRSYALLKTIEAYNKLVIEMEFKSYTYDGILLYNAENEDGLGDFVSLSLVNGFVEFKYNLGHGPVIMRSLDKIELGKFHKVVVKRYNRDGLLKLDDADDVAAQAAGSTKALDLKTDTYIGYVPTNYTRVFEIIGTDKGFEGCIKKLKIGREEIELHTFRHEMVLETKGIHDCSQHACEQSPCLNQAQCVPMDDLFRCECPPQFSGKFCDKLDDPCMSNPCVFGAMCKAFDQDTYICKCKPGRTGKRCEIEYKNDKVVIPEFNGRSYIRFPPMKVIEKTFSIEVSFMPKAPNGLILYSGQMKNGLNNFISLNLAHGYLQFRFSLGGGTVDLMSLDPIVIRKWHKARISGKGKEGILQVDNSSIVFGYSDAPIRDVVLDSPLFVGSIPEREDENNNLFSFPGWNKGFRGIIQGLAVNGNPLPITNILSDCSYNPSNNSCASNVGFYEGLPCPLFKNPCLNNGVCVPDLDHFTCQCPHKFKGKRCEIEDQGPIKFTGNTHLQYKLKGFRSYNHTDIANQVVVQLKRKRKETNIFDYNGEEELRKSEFGNDYKFELQTFVADGLLLWRSRTKRTAREYFAIAIENGYPQVSFNLGRDKRFFSIRGTKRIDDGHWHTVHVKRKKRIGMISVDDGRLVRGRSSPGSKGLKTTAKLWIGGTSSLPPGLPGAYYKGFYGCIKEFLVHNKPFDLLSTVDDKKVNFCHVNDV